jgi:PadR family transcriptional regulator PadR
LRFDKSRKIAISERIQQISNNALQIQRGSLYPSLHRLERRGLIKAAWATTDNNRKAKYYALTRAGRRKLAADTDIWRKLTSAVDQVLRTT